MEATSTLDEYLQRGQAGRDALRDALDVSGSSDHALARKVLFEICTALAHVHACGIVHRDVKPENLLVDAASKTLRLIDFGSSCDVAGLLVKRGWRTDRVPCSILYCAPEQRIDAKAPYAFDIYSAALIWLSVAIPAISASEQALYDLRMSWRDHRYGLAAWHAAMTDAADAEGMPWRELLDWSACTANGEPLPANARTNEAAWQLLHRLIDPRPDHRFSAAEALLSSYLNADCATEAVPMQALDARSYQALATRGGAWRTLDANECLLPDYD